MLTNVKVSLYNVQINSCNTTCTYMHKCLYIDQLAVAMFPGNVCVWNDQKRKYAKKFVCKSIIQKKENLLHGNT